MASEALAVETKRNDGVWVCRIPTPPEDCSCNMRRTRRLGTGLDGASDELVGVLTIVLGEDCTCHSVEASMPTVRLGYQAELTV